MPRKKCGKPKSSGRLCTDCLELKEKKARTSYQAWVRYLWKKWHITPERYQEILDEQGGVCYICHRAPGKKRLAVDHDHELERQGVPIEDTIRGLLDRNCNYVVLGHLKEERAAYLRAIEYLDDPPARRMIK